MNGLLAVLLTGADRKPCPGPRPSTDLVVQAFHSGFPPKVRKAPFENSSPRAPHAFEEGT